MRTLTQVAAGTVLTSPLATSVPLQAASITPALAKKIRRYRELVKANDDFDKDVLAPAREAWQAAVQAIPHKSFEPYRGATGQEVVPTTASRTLVAIARGIERTLETPAGAGLKDVGHRDPLRALAKAADERDEEAARLREQYLDDLVERSDEMSEQTSIALDDVLDHPGTTSADLIAKLELMLEVSSFDVETLLPIIIDDVRRMSVSLH